MSREQSIPRTDQQERKVPRLRPVVVRQNGELTRSLAYSLAAAAARLQPQRKFASLQAPFATRSRPIARKQVLALILQMLFCFLLQLKPVTLQEQN